MLISVHSACTLTNRHADGQTKTRKAYTERHADILTSGHAGSKHSERQTGRRIGRTQIGRQNRDKGGNQANKQTG